jgi:HD-GYP domain-containing protein (c-di-GMP phosphodiesterase class II)
VNRNIYNKSGTLIIPEQEILTQRDIELLAYHSIDLEAEDLDHIALRPLIDSAISEVKDYFRKVRHSNQIPYTDVREKIIPLIIQLSSQSNLSEVFKYMESHDEYTYRHSISVSLIARLIGGAKGFNEQAQVELTMAGFLHDIGKVRVPDPILNKPGKLTKEEFEQVKQHTIYGFDIIRNSPGIPYRHALVALQHHEREDGSGYPYGLKSREIDEYSKIVAVADVFHAMISRRVYKEPVPFYKVLKEMSENAYGLLEPRTTLCFVKKIMDMLIGNRVRLSNGMEGKIILIHAIHPVKPLVEVNGKYLDLSKDSSIYIDQIL